MAECFPRYLHHHLYHCELMLFIFLCKVDILFINPFTPNAVSKTALKLPVARHMPSGRQFRICRHLWLSSALIWINLTVVLVCLLCFPRICKIFCPVAYDLWPSNDLRYCVKLYQTGKGLNTLCTNYTLCQWKLSCLWKFTGYLKNHRTKHSHVCTHFDPFSMLIQNMNMKCNKLDFFWKCYQNI